MAASTTSAPEPRPYPEDKNQFGQLLHYCVNQYGQMYPFKLEGRPYPYLLNVVIVPNTWGARVRESLDDPSRSLWRGTSDIYQSWENYDNPELVSMFVEKVVVVGVFLPGWNGAGDRAPAATAAGESLDFTNVFAQGGEPQLAVVSSDKTRRNNMFVIVDKDNGARCWSAASCGRGNVFFFPEYRNGQRNTTQRSFTWPLSARDVLRATLSLEI